MSDPDDKIGIIEEIVATRHPWATGAKGSSQDRINRAHMQRARRKFKIVLIAWASTIATGTGLYFSDDFRGAALSTAKAASMKALHSVDNFIAQKTQHRRRIGDDIRPSAAIEPAKKQQAEIAPPKTPPAITQNHIVSCQAVHDFFRVQQPARDAQIPNTMVNNIISCTQETDSQSCTLSKNFFSNVVAQGGQIVNLSSSMHKHTRNCASTGLKAG